MKKVKLRILSKGAFQDKEFALKPLTAKLRVELSAIRATFAKKVEDCFTMDDSGSSWFDKEVLPTLDYTEQATIKSFLHSGMYADAIRRCAAHLELCFEGDRLAQIASCVVDLPKDIEVDWEEQDIAELRKLDEFFR